jgi:hypothetical protein
VAPDDEAVTGARPVFIVGYSGVAPGDERRLRFRIELAAEAREGKDYRFDQRRSRSGWLPGDVDEVQFRPPRPLADGAYRWDVAVWDGVAWSPAGTPRRLRVDSVAPAWVDSLRVELEPDGTRVRLTWKPVTADLAGAPEFVARYHVYRFELGPQQPLVRPYRIGTVETPGFVDERPPADRAILFYRIAAEDHAGNVTGVRQ